MKQEREATEMRKKLVSILLCAAAAVMMMAGCGSANTEGVGSQAAAADGKKEVVIWDYFETDAQKAMMQELLDGFPERVYRKPCLCTICGL